MHLSSACCCGTVLLAFLFSPPTVFAATEDVPELADQTFDCLIEPRVTSKVSAAASGIISELYVDRGDIVKVGQAVAKLESSVEEAALELAKARVDNDLQIRSTRTRAEFLRKKAGRLEKLRPNNTVSEATFEEATAEALVAEFNLREAEANQKVAQADLKRTQAQLDQRLIRSPVSGVVLERALSAGEYRNEQSHILTIAQINVLNVEVFIPIAFYGQMHVDSRAAVMPEEPVGGTHIATITIVDRVLDAASGTFGVRLALVNPDYRLPGGLRCKVRFLAEAAKLNGATSQSGIK